MIGPGHAPQPTSRRRFLRWLGLASLAAGATPVALAAQGKPKAGAPAAVKPPAPPQPPDTVAAAPARPAPLVPSEDARALLSVIERRYGKQLSKEQLETIAKEIEGDLRAGARLRDVKLANSDEPDVTFHA